MTFADASMKNVAPKDADGDPGNHSSQELMEGAFQEQVPVAREATDEIWLNLISSIRSNHGWRPGFRSLSTLPPGVIPQRFDAGDALRAPKMLPHCDIGAVGRGSEHRQTACQKIQQQHANPEGSAAVPSGLSAQGLAIMRYSLGIGVSLQAHRDSRDPMTRSKLTIGAPS
jgi:hypothetical protein